MEKSKSQQPKITPHRIIYSTKGAKQYEGQLVNMEKNGYGNEYYAEGCLK
jgi:hypothetical protein